MLFGLLVALCLAYLVGGVVLPYGKAGIVGAISKRFLPVWIALIVIFALSITFKRRLGLYGKLFDSHDRHDRLRAGDVLGLHRAVRGPVRHGSPPMTRWPRSRA